MSFTLKSTEHLFPTPLLRFAVEDAEALNRALLEEIAARRVAEPGVTRSNFGGWHSAKDFFDRSEPAHRRLALDLMRMMAEATRAFDPKLDITRVQLVPDGWVNVNPTGAYNGPHDHKTAFWSGTYYVDNPPADGSSGMIEFLSPHHPLPSSGVVGGPLTAEVFATRPEAGSALLFPSNLLHWVHPNQSSADRVTIAFNGRFRSKGPTVSRRGGGARPRS